jgi:hypothetical protein
VGDGVFMWVLIGVAGLVLLAIVAYVNSWRSRP